MLTQRQIFDDLMRGPGPALIRQMSPKLIEAFLVEFPWVRRHIGNVTISTVCVDRIEKAEKEILGYQPLFENFESRLTDFRGEWLGLLDEDGNLLARECIETRDQIRYWRLYWLFGFVVRTTKVHKFTGLVKRGSTVGKTLGPLRDLAPSVRFILSYYVFTQTVIVHKVPDGILLEGNGVVS